MRTRTLAAIAATLASLAAPAAVAEPASAPANQVAGTAEAYRPAASFDLDGTLLSLSALLASRVESVSAFRVDAGDDEFDPGTHVDLLTRVGAQWMSHERFAPWFLGAELELDAFTGLVTAAPDFEGDGMPNSGGSDTLVLRKANATVSLGGVVALRVGAMTSHWGLGLVANDGAHFWEPGSADLTDPRGGDRVLRAQLVARTPGERYVAVSLAADRVLADDVLRDGDEAYQAIAAVLVQRDDARAGVYGVARFQDAEDGAELRAYVLDLFGEARFALSDRVSLTLATEWALIAGTTTLAPSLGFPEHDVLQLGGVVRATIDAGNLGGVIDLLYASGDSDANDVTQSAFKADPNFSLGVVLFPYLVAAQTGRAAHTALAPDLTGHPPEDIDRYPTRGSVSNTVAIFPRVWIRPADGLELYGGTLIAFAAVDPADPLNTRLAGGDPRNARDAAPGAYLGTEIDLGARYRLIAWGSELTVGVEGGLLMPGSALSGAGLRSDGVIAGGRAMITWKL